MFLLIYIHCRLHDDTAAFVHDLFCKAEFKEFVDENFGCYMGSVHNKEAFEYAQSVGITGELFEHSASPSIEPRAFHYDSDLFVLRMKTTNCRHKRTCVSHLPPPPLPPSF